MSRGGFRAAGFMDGFMSGFDFVDRLQRADEERSERQERNVQDYARRQQEYDLQSRGEYGLLEGRTATSPQTGARLIRRSGRWEVFHE
ncbi:MAG TPA: hypothetical protein VGE22_05935 [Solimonas sp.]